MSCRKCQYETPVGIVIVYERRNSTNEVTGYEGAMLGDDGSALSKTERNVAVCGTDAAYLRQVRHLLKEAVVTMFRENYPKMAMDRWNVHVAAGTAKIVHQHLCTGAIESGII